MSARQLGLQVGVDVEAGDRAVVGGKAAATHALALRGVRVPPSLALPAVDVGAHLARAAGDEDRATFARALLAGDVRARARVGAEPADPALVDAVLRFAAAHAHTAPLVIVRSSGVHEDSGPDEDVDSDVDSDVDDRGIASASLAGHYESVVCRPQRVDVDAALRRCLAKGVQVFYDLVLDDDARALAASGSDREVLALFARAERALALLVQPVVDAVVSGVCFTRAPVGPAHDALVVAMPGTCHPVVDGRLAQDMFTATLDDTRTEVRALHARVRHKFECTVVCGDVRADDDTLMPGAPLTTVLGPTTFHAPYGPGLAQVRTPEPRASAAALDDDGVRAVVAAALACRAAIGCEADVEWSIDATGTLTVLQARPITAVNDDIVDNNVDNDHADNDHADGDTDNDAVIATGLVASAGVARGPVRIVLSLDDAARVEPGDILAVTATDPDYMPALYKCAGIVSEDGSPLSHTAIVARELRLPCLVGVARATRGLVAEGAVVVVDAVRGRVIADGAVVEEAAVIDVRDDVIDDLADLARVAHVSGNGVVRVAASAVFDAFFVAFPGAVADVSAVAAFVAARVCDADRGVDRVDVVWDIVDDELAALERDPLFSALRAELPAALAAALAPTAAATTAATTTGAR